jgi:hypothetical protein
MERSGHAELRLIELPDRTNADDPEALARVVIGSWPLWQRVVFGRRSRRAMIKTFGDYGCPTD